VNARHLPGSQRGIGVVVAFDQNAGVALAKSAGAANTDLGVMERDQCEHDLMIDFKGGRVALWRLKEDSNRVRNLTN
jgi:hypothetical protein